ncbi:NHLP family bacteriocin export ABC transporter peptidase/permease/ATPase subunit [Nostoc sp. MS1]|uniref:NHLP family bacteriocin export ABC transporter peptidase/permease/ATPase subunit n=1 Tax=Nostoc sp. MS1 TaxID=2764711 RepID=UPI001CC647A2|nr:NHLP family bacteriocin export ABC transporter peptidase/permease/ATPase subunit [Nostoc sp. MS1]BCL39335.1 NHLP family bacteriocin export ABC transporter peptidase/permease/ATPase [Nostoc sp. MS1]
MSDRTKFYRKVKTPLVLQMESVECGAAALGIILAYFGRIVPLAELRQACGVSRDGSGALDIVKAARQYGLVAKIFKKGIAALIQQRPPYIVFWNFNHFVVVEGFSGDAFSEKTRHKSHVWINDPAIGQRRVSFPEFDDAYTGVVLVLEPGPDFIKGGSKPSVIQNLATRLQGSYSTLAYCVLISFLLIIPSITIPVCTQIFVDEVLLQGREHWLRPLILGMLVVILFEGTLAWLRLLHLRRFRVVLSVKMSSNFLWHILHLPINFYSQRYAGEVASRQMLNNRVAQVLSGQLATTLIDAVLLIIYSFIMYQYDTVLATTTVFLAIANFVVLKGLSQKRIAASIQLSQVHGMMTGVGVGGLKRIEMLKASGLESDFFARWAGHQAKVINIQQEVGIPTRLLQVLPIFLSSIAFMSLIVLGGWRVMNGYLSIGTLIAFQSLMIRFMQPINGLVEMGSTLQELVGDIDRLEDVLSNPMDQNCQLSHKEQVREFADSIDFLTDIELENITFGYNKAAAPLIENFNLSLTPGKTVAIVGASGSGKSTVARLVAGLYEPWDGQVLINGRSRHSIPKYVLYEDLTMVEQEIFLFTGTVRDNLTLWNHTVDQETLASACQDAEIADTILALPGGYNAEILEGGLNLSGGERQRLEIARSLVSEPKILILDEATSALDPQTERRVMENLRHRGCACLIVAHRLSAIRDCDEIIVLQAGQVVERGTHPELWQQQGVYAALIRSEGDSL